MTITNTDRRYAPRLLNLAIVLGTATAMLLSAGETFADERRGTRVTSSRQVTRDGDEVTVSRQAQRSTGASVDKVKEYEIENGRVESVERSVFRTDRYGRTAHWEGDAERAGAGWSFEGDGRNRAGQSLSVDGYASRGYYGSGAIADVQGGRYGDRTIVAGRSYAGPTHVRTLPYRAARPGR
jgi:hypothetical protein